MGDQAKPLLPFLQRGDEMQKADPKVAYYCRMYAMEARGRTFFFFKRNFAKRNAPTTPLPGPLDDSPASIATCVCVEMADARRRRARETPRAYPPKGGSPKQRVLKLTYETNKTPDAVVERDEIPGNRRASRLSTSRTSWSSCWGC